MPVRLLALGGRVVGVMGCALAICGPDVSAQVVREAAAAQEAAPLQVVIEREPLVIRSPDTYKVSLHLEPIKSIKLAAQVDGTVATVLAKMDGPIQAQAEVVRLDSRDRQLELDRAKAALDVARLAEKSAADAGAKAVATAQAKVAEIEVELAQYRLEQSTVRAPFDGIIQRVHVVEGQFVRAGEPIATIIDDTQLQVELPVDRQSVKSGDQMQIRVENQLASATVSGVLPLTAPFEPLRDLFESIATGMAVVDNKSKQFQPGQTVYASMIPRLPVAEVPNQALGNTDEGGRRIQVIRDGFVRNINVELLGAVGEEQTIVTGRFTAGDEVIVRSSEELLDGTQVVPRTQLEAAAATEGTDRGAGAAPGSPPKPGGF